MNGLAIIIVAIVFGILGFYSTNLTTLNQFDLEGQLNSFLFGNGAESKIESVGNIPAGTQELIENGGDITLEKSEKELKTERKVHRLVNIQREKHGLRSLDYDKELSAVAKMHSSDMIKRGFFSHENPDGLSPTERAEKQSYACAKVDGIYATYGIGENIFHMRSAVSLLSTPDYIAKKAVEGWMQSPGHRENILNNGYDREGIGVVFTETTIVITQNFC